MTILMRHAVRLTLFALFLVLGVNSPVSAEKFWESPKLTYPEIWNSRVTSECSNWFETPGLKTCSEWKPVFQGIHSHMECIGYIETGGIKTCVGWDVKWEYRKAMRWLEIQGPDLTDYAREVLRGLAILCATTAHAQALAAYASASAGGSPAAGIVAYLPAFWGSFEGCVMTGGYGAITAFSLVKGYIDKLEIIPRYDAEWTTLISNVSSDPDETPPEFVPTQEEIKRELENIEKINEEIEELTLPQPREDQVNTAEMRAKNIREIYQLVWRRTPRPSELGTALSMFENGRSYEEVESYVRERKNKLLALEVLNQYATDGF